MGEILFAIVVVILLLIFILCVLDAINARLKETNRHLKGLSQPLKERSHDPRPL